ncbi:SHOCT domain-containing protein [Williamsia muralis]|nr:SHOCT domain-containing protein [Williamsia muralis]
MTEGVAVTNRRLLGFWGLGHGGKHVLLEAAADEILRVEYPEKFGRRKLMVTTTTKEINFGDVRNDEFEFVQYYVSYLIEASGKGTQRGPQESPRPEVAAPIIAVPSRSDKNEREAFPVYGRALDSFWSRPIQTYSAIGELPWFVVNNAPVGLLAAFEDRLLVVGLVQGRYGSSVETSAAAFAYADIAKIEYPGGFVDGVLEVRTVSDLGSARPSISLRLPRSVYEEVAPKIEAVRAVVASLQPMPVPVAQSPLRPQGDTIGDQERKLIRDNSGPNEEPWMIIHGGDGAGVLAAFDDRLLVSTKVESKKGGVRTNTAFSFTNIKKIEYTEGQSNDVLEVVTWKRRDANDQSNRLELPVGLRKKVLPNVQELRRRVFPVDGPPVSMWKPPLPPRVVAEPPSGSGLVAELQKLADLHAQGLIDDDEFKEAKRAVIAGRAK